MYAQMGSMVDFFRVFEYNLFVAEQISLRGAGRFRLRLDEAHPDP